MQQIKGFLIVSDFQSYPFIVFVNRQKENGLAAFAVEHKMEGNHGRNCQKFK